MNEYPANFGQLSLVPVLVFFAYLMVACSESNTITEYSLKKVDPIQNHGHEWLPLNPTTYRIEINTVVSETAGILSKYEKCTTMSVENWECQYSDGSGSFGFRNGKFWELPEVDDVIIVSRFEYNRVNCEWAYEDKYEGKIWGAVRCIIGWF